MTTATQNQVTDHWNLRANSYNFNINRDFFRHHVSDRWRELLSEAIGNASSQKILDAGCGPAVLTRLLLDLGHQVTAVDVSGNMIELAKQTVGKKNDQVSFYQADMAELPFADAGFDMIFSRYVVWTLPDPVKVLKEWQRLLRPGGRIGIIDGNWYYHYYRSRIRRYWAHVSNFTYKVRSGFDPGQKIATHYAYDLPSTHVLRPDWDLGVLAGLGFKNIKVYPRVERRIWGTWSWKRLKNPWTHQFLIMAEQ